jgi:putative transposase
MTREALYAKLARTDPGFGAALVRHIAARPGPVVAALAPGRADAVPGYRVTARVLLLDKSFFSIAVMRLSSRELPLVTPAAIRGRKPRPGVEAGGRRAIRRRGAGRYPYTHEDRGASVRVYVVVAYESYRDKKTGRRSGRALRHATWRVSGRPAATNTRAGLRT